MNRLIEKIVFSGLTIAWRRATCPTMRSPVFGLTATTDGTSRPPSEDGITVGSPPSMMATTELVVPRSIPMILPMVIISCSSGDSDKRRPENSVVQDVSLPDHVDHVAIFDFVVVFVGQRFVEVGIETFSVSLDRFDAFGFEQCLELVVDQLDPLGPGLAFAFRRTILERPLQVIQDGQESGEDAAGGPGVALLLVPLAAFLVVGELGPGALPAVEVLVRLTLRRLKEGRQRLGFLHLDDLGWRGRRQLLFRERRRPVPERGEDRLFVLRQILAVHVFDRFVYLFLPFCHSTASPGQALCSSDSVLTR